METGTENQQVQQPEDKFASYVEQVKQEVAARGDEGGEGGDQGAAGADQGGAAAAAAGTQQQATEPSPIESATNGKFKTLEEFDSFLAQAEEWKNKKVEIPEEQQRILDFVDTYGDNAYQMVQLSKTDVSKLSPQQVFAQSFATKPENLGLSPAALNQGWQHDLKTRLGNPNLVIDFADENYGVDDFYKERIENLMNEDRGTLGEFYKTLIPSSPKRENTAEDTGKMPSLSDQVKQEIAQEVSAYKLFNPKGLDALGEGGKNLQISVEELPEFANAAKQISENPQKWLESVFMIAGSEGKPAKLNTQAMLDYAALMSGATPMLLQKYGKTVGDERHAAGLAEGTGKTLEETRNAMGLNDGKSQSDTRSEAQKKAEEVRTKADDFWGKAKQGKMA